MSLFEYSVVGLNFFCDDKEVREELLDKSFLNMNIYNFVCIENEKLSNKSNITIEKIYKNEVRGYSFYYLEDYLAKGIFGEDKMEIYAYDEEVYHSKEDICFVASKEEFITLKDFRGYLICLEDAYVEGVRNQQIVVKNREDALNIIYSMYFMLNSYHIFPCHLSFPMTRGFDIIIDKICIKHIENYKVIYWLYRNIGLSSKELAAFLITNDTKLRTDFGIEAYEKLDKTLNHDESMFYVTDKDKNHGAVSLYSFELEKILDR